MLTNRLIGVGSHVRVRDQDGETEYTIVRPEESDVTSGRISDESPLAAALMGHYPGERVRVRAPGGLRSVMILGVSQAAS
jgi:transcription elongation factor GreA